MNNGKIARTLGSLLVGAAVASVAPAAVKAQNYEPWETREFQVGEMSSMEEVAVKLVNSSSTDITYQAVGEMEATKPRVLAAGEEVTLRSLNMPTSVLFYRQDGGLLAARIDETSAKEVLTTIISDSDSLDRDDRFLRIQESGQIEIR